ncbi:nuclear pore complex protein Nup214 isoform X2 [Anthonomus grandis grandis]|uniref:nuclear pore complex protein Nup214 isoform X2 n=1 Tax=Anthonomus grandis grandis TaxID=2921223 RepID=UPI00216635DA|nr:nuclear pore complex protein Nup214 isoform X2 [Anthonomus grandis grandis]
MLKTCPGSVDVTDLQFKLQCHLKVFENKDFSPFSHANSLLTCASRYGLLFTGSTSNHFQVIQTKILQNYSPKEKDVINYPRRTIQLSSPPKHLCVNCDSTVLAVIIEKDSCPVVIFYDVLSFLSQNVKVLQELRLSSTPNVFIREINWNPSLPMVFTACKSDNTLGVYELKGTAIDINELPSASQATSFCWSPKGKQIAVGSADGKITQYKPDLKAVKIINAPKFEGQNSIISLQWVSNYQFIAAYLSTKDGVANIVVVDAPKTGEPTFTNYEDICYSGTSREAQFYMILQQNWNFLMVASANSAEVGVLGLTGETWTQWITSDTARAELPLSPDHEETLPVGFTFDISSTKPLPWGESTIPPCPMLCILSHQGVLCCFNIVNLKEGVPSVCTPPDPIQDTSGLSTFTSEVAVSNQPKEIPVTTEASTKTNFAMPNIIQSTPLPAAKAPTETAKTLFESRPSLTPIKPSGVPLFGGQSIITPVTKTTSAPPPAPSNFSEKYSSIFSSLTPTSTQASTAPVKPIVVTTKPPEPKPQEVIPPKVVAEVPKQPSTLAAEIPKGETTVMIAEIIKDEWLYLEAELRILINLGRNVKVHVGTDQEKIDMIEKIDGLQDFVREASEISVGQSNEIHLLKQNLIQSWAWFEEAKSHYNASKNEAIALLIKMQPLDSLAQKRLQDVEQLAYYIESQLSQANKTLDEQWDKFQDYAKKSYKFQTPTMEAIFQTMVRQNVILQKKLYVLKDIASQLKSKPSNVSSLLSNLDLADDFSELHLDPRSILQLQIEKIKNRSKHLSEAKVGKLRRLLKSRDVVKVTAVKPQVSSWALNQSPASKMRQSISMLGSSTSPSTKSSIAKILDFSSSTPEKPTTLQKSQGSAFTPICTAAPASQQSFFYNAPNISFGADTSKPTSTFSTPPKVNTTASVTFKAPAGTTFSFGSTPPKAADTTVTKPSGASSIFSNLQSVIDKATEPTKSAFSFSGAIATTQSVVSSSSSSAVSNSFFGKTVQPPTSKVITVSLFDPKIPKTTDSTVSETSSAASLGTISRTASSTSVSDSNKGDVSKVPNKPFMFGTPGQSGGLFGSTAATTAASSSVESKAMTLFGSTATTKSLFTPAVEKPVSTSAVKTIFGSASTTFTVPATSSTSLFANFIWKASSTTAAPTVSLFSSTFATPSGGTAVTSSVLDSSSAQAKNIFSSATPTSTAENLVASKTVTAAVSTETTSSVSSPSTANIFASAPATTTPETPATITSLFGGTSGTTITSETTSTAGSSLFSSTTSTSIFGTPTSEVGASSESQTATKPSLGITSAASSSSSLFGAAPSTIAQGTNALFGKTAGGIATMAAEVSSAATPLLGSPATTTQSIFGAAPQATTSSSLFGTSTPFGSTSSAANVFGSTTTQASATSLFGTSTAPQTTTASVFGASTVTTQASSSVFGTPTTPQTTTSSIFGTPTTPQTSTTSIFGTPTAPQTTTTSVFGTPTAPQTTAASIFGTPTAPQTTSSSIFGGSPASGNIFASAASNIFGSSTASSGFGGGAVASTASSVFGSGTTSTSSNVFGSTATTTSSVFGSGGGSIFGGGSPSVFGQSATFGTAQSGFGQTTTASSVFGQPVTTASVFGQAAGFGSSAGTNAFGTTATASTGSIFGGASSAPSSGFGSGFGSQSSTSNIFGSPSTTQASTGSFGFGSLAVGGTASPGGSIFGGSTGTTFGQTTPQANPFGKVESKPLFGSNTGNIFASSAVTSASTNIFGTPASTSSSIFGGGSSTSTFGNPAAGTTGFGSPSTFGSSAFGQPPSFGSSAFSSPQQSGGPFSGSAQSVAQSGFGSPTSFQKPAGFGAAPVFGGAPSGGFGAAPAFGAGASFGAAAPFGSPDKVFGGGQPSTGTFGSTTAQNSAFGNLANQNTIGFGNLAQQANTPSSMPFSGGNSSFSSWR